MAKGTPFESRSLLDQEQTIAKACNSRLEKLPPESHRRVLDMLIRSADDRLVRPRAPAQPETIPAPQGEDTPDENPFG